MTLAVSLGVDSLGVCLDSRKSEKLFSFGVLLVFFLCMCVVFFLKWSEEQFIDRH